MSTGFNNILIILSEIRHGGISDFATRKRADQRWAGRSYKKPDSIAKFAFRYGSLIEQDVPRVDYEKLASDRTDEASEAVRQRVLCARERQLARFDGSGLACNADMDPAHIREYCELDGTSKALMRSAMNQLGMSARAFHRVLKWMEVDTTWSHITDHVIEH